MGDPPKLTSRPMQVLIADQQFGRYGASWT